MFFAGRKPSVAVLVMRLTGCANLSQDQGMDTIQSMTAASLGQDAVKIRTEQDSTFVKERATLSC
jgi:hypothetical protein